MAVDLKNIAKQSHASQDEFEMWQLLELVALTSPRMILEIGVDKGHSMVTWQTAFPDAYVAGIDDVANLDFPEGYLNVLVGDSKDPAQLEEVRKWLGIKQLDFLFIDGDHHYDMVRSDYEMYGPLVRPGGIIAFHDIMRMPGEYDGVESRRLFDEIRPLNKTIELWGGTNCPGTGVVFK